MAAKKANKKKDSTGTPGETVTRTITKGPNKGDKVVFKFATGGKPFPIRVIKDVGKKSTLRNNPGVKIGRTVKKTGVTME